jgi:transposase InsO family protein
MLNWLSYAVSVVAGSSALLTYVRQGCLQPMLTGEPWERVGIGITGPHSTSSKGHIYILTLIDHFTKWIEIFLMRNQEASTVDKLLVDRVFCVHGLPLQILTDQDRNFESELFKEICRFLTVDKIKTTAYKPSTNGNIERFHVTLNSMLAKLVSENQKDWDDKLAAVAFAYRNSVQELTGFFSCYLMYGREARIPADIVYRPPGAAHAPYTSNSEFLAD